MTSLTVTHWVEEYDALLLDPVRAVVAERFASFVHGQVGELHSFMRQCQVW